MNELYQTLISVLGADEDRKGEWHCPCQFCGKLSSPKDPHHSFNEQGFHCFVCGEGGSLKKLADQAGITTETPLPIVPKPAPKPKPVPEWKKHATEYLQSVVSADELFPKWKQYKPLSTASIAENYLGYGKLPHRSSRCTHNRLIIPLIQEKRLVGIRGRQVECDCGKWLSASGSEMVLYNSDTLEDAAGKAVLIVENPIDALLLEQQNIKAVATMGVTMWKDEWTEMIKHSGCTLVTVVYDKDLAGNGASTEAEYHQMAEEWKLKNPKARQVPMPNGIRLVNNLNKAGIRATLYHWEEKHPFKTDIGDLLCEQ